MSTPNTVTAPAPNLHPAYLRWCESHLASTLSPDVVLVLHQYNEWFYNAFMSGMAEGLGQRIVAVQPPNSPDLESGRTDQPAPAPILIP